MADILDLIYGEANRPSDLQTFLESFPGGLEKGLEIKHRIAERRRAEKTLEDILGGEDLGDLERFKRLRVGEAKELAPLIKAGSSSELGLLGLLLGTERLKEQSRASQARESLTGQQIEMLRAARANAVAQQRRASLERERFGITSELQKGGLASERGSALKLRARQIDDEIAGGHFGEPGTLAQNILDILGIYEPEFIPAEGARNPKTSGPPNLQEQARQELERRRRGGR